MSPDPTPKSMRSCGLPAGRIRGWLSIGVAAILLPSCSGLSTPPGGLGVPHLESRSSGTKPSWVDALGQWQSHHPDREYFVGTTPKEPDQQSGRTDAYEDALRSVVGRVGTRARSLYREVSSREMGVGTGGMDMSVRRRVRSLVSTSARAMVGGVRIEDFFWQKFWEKDQDGANPYFFYKYSVLVSIGKDQYEQLVRHALKGARESTGDPQMKSLLGKMIGREAASRP